jgi:hypothetical protein
MNILGNVHFYQMDFGYDQVATGLHIPVDTTSADKVLQLPDMLDPDVYSTYGRTHIVSNVATPGSFHGLVVSGWPGQTIEGLGVWPVSGGQTRMMWWDGIASKWRVSLGEGGGAAAVSGTPITFNFSVVPVSGGVLTVGDYSLPLLEIPADCVIDEVVIYAPPSTTANARVDIKNSDYTTYDTFTTLNPVPFGPNVALKYRDTVLSGWNRNLFANNVLQVVVAAISGSCPYLSIDLKATRLS